MTTVFIFTPDFENDKRQSALWIGANSHMKVQRRLHTYLQIDFFIDTIFQLNPSKTISSSKETINFTMIIDLRH